MKGKGSIEVGGKEGMERGGGQQDPSFCSQSQKKIERRELEKYMKGEEMRLGYLE